MYKPFSRFILRTPLLPFQGLEKILYNKENLFKELNKIQIQEAIFWASPQLTNELTKLLNNEIGNLDEQERLINTMVKYLSRMSSRSTPFGLFAGCSVGTLGFETDIEVSSNFDYKIRLDMQLLYSISRALNKNMIIAENIKYKVNSSIYQLGNHYRYIESYLKDDSHLMYKISSVDKTDYLDRVLSKAQKKTHFKELVESIVSGDVDFSDAKLFILQLISNQIIVSEIDPYVCGSDYFTKIIEQLNISKLKENVITNTLTIIEDYLLNAKLNGHLTLYKDISEKLKRLEIPFDNLHVLQVDMKKNTNSAVLGATLITNLQSTLSLLNKITPTEGRSSLYQFQKVFSDRFEEKEIPLLLALDSEIGIGYPINAKPSDIAPLIDNFSLPQNSKHSSTVNRTKFSAILQKKYFEYKMKGLKELIFVDDDFRDFDENWSDLPDTFFALFQIVHNEPDILLKINAVSGISAANLITRFAYCDSDINSFIEEIARKEDELINESIIAEIVHLPDSRSGNIVSRPHIRKYEIVCLINTDLSDEFQIPISDLMISIKGGKLQLRSKKLNKQIIPRLTSAHNYQNDSIAVYRFLCDYQYYNLGRSCLYFDWGELGQELDFKPRVKYNNSILSSANWKIYIDEFKPFFLIKVQSDMIVKINKWRKAKLMPKLILLSEGDNKLFVDWESIISVTTLFSVVKNKQSVIFEEFLFDADNAAVNGIEGSYTNECIVAFHK